MNETIMQFGYPETVIREYDSWIVMLRPQQVTLGSLVLACKGEYEKLSTVPASVFSELEAITYSIEKTLSTLFQYDRINYLLLMMRDKYVHFHVIPRYAGIKEMLDIEFKDETWPLPPDITKPMSLSKEHINALTQLLRKEWMD